MAPYTLRPVTAADCAFPCDLHVATIKPYVTQVWAGMSTGGRNAFASALPSTACVVVADGQQIGVREVEERPAELFLANLRIVAGFQAPGR